MSKYISDEVPSSWTYDKNAQLAFLIAAGAVLCSSYAASEMNRATSDSFLPSIRVLDRGMFKVSSSNVKLTYMPYDEPFVPKTEFGSMLQELRKKAINQGMSLLTTDEIAAEVEVRRGGVKS